MGLPLIIIDLEVIITFLKMLMVHLSIMNGFNSMKKNSIYHMMTNQI